MKIEKLPTHNLRLIAVPNEKFTDVPKQIEHGDDLYKVLDYFVYTNREPMSYGMLLLATGELFDEDKIWQAYPKSNKLYFFIVQKEK